MDALPFVRATLLAVWLLPSSAPLSLGQEQAAANAAAASIENGRLRVAVDSQDGNLLELTDLDAHFNLVGDDKASAGLWELELVRAGRRAVLMPEQAKTFQWKVLGSWPRALRLTWSHFTLPEADQCKVQVTVRLGRGEKTSHWRIAVERPPRAWLDKIRFPRVHGVRRQRDERLAVPVWLGQQLANPRNLLRGSDGHGRRLGWDYPGRLSLQCLAYYGKGGRGLYVACDDTAVRRKTFAMWATTGDEVHFEMVHYPAGPESQADRYELPYQVSLGTFLGDWVTAAERYRTWAIEQRWARQSRLRRGLVPKWVLRTGLWVWNRGRSPGVLPPAAILQDRLGLPVSVFWHWWHGCPYDIGFPEYLPPREGTKPFQQAVAQAHQDGLRMLVYMNSRAWGMSTRSWQAEGAQRYAVKGEDGKVQPEVYNLFTHQALASMCLATPFWRNKYAGLAEQACNDLGVDGIYMDQACSQRPCYDPRHGHPLGGGNSWIEGFRALSADIRHRCQGRRPPIVLAGEGCGEAWLPTLDLMLALQVSKERYSAANDPWEVIPFFPAVYHRVAITYGNYSSLTMPPYDELWPAEFAPPKPLTLLDRKYSRQFYLEQARTFVWGQQPALANFLPAQRTQRGEENEYVLRLARVRSQATKYLLDGEYLRPPELHAPQGTSDFSRLSIYAGQKDRLTSSRKQHPMVIAGAWRAKDGDVAVALASVADQAISLRFAIDRRYYRLPERPPIGRIDAAGRQPLDIPLDEDGTFQIVLPARAAWLIEFSKKQADQ